MNWKCDFCKHHTAPYKPGDEKCAGCENGKNNFTLRKFMHPMQEHEWDLHQRLERFIDCLDMDLKLWQREILHRILERGNIPIGCARSCGRSSQRINLDILMCEFYISMLREGEEKENKEKS